MARDYVFIDEWDVDAPQDAVFHALRACAQGVGEVLRYLTPVLRPVFFRWNHNWSVKRAIEGLEPYARSHPPGPGDSR